jgi:hypothetical protein
MNVQKLQTRRDPVQGAAVVTSQADPVLDLLRRWRATAAANIEANARARAADEAYRKRAGGCPTFGDRQSPFAPKPEIARSTDPDGFKKIRPIVLREDLDDAKKRWWIGYFEACGALSDEEDRLAFLQDDLEKAILSAPATPLGIVAKIELALDNIPVNPIDDYLPSILAAAKADAERLARGAA